MARVVKAWTKSYDPALHVRAGDPLTLGPLDDEYPGWRWCTDANGLGGWLPVAVVDAVVIGTEGGKGRAIDDFDTTELTVAAGDTLTITARRLGWSFCRTPDGAAGWVPDDCLSDS
ncbi:SH3 domain-containing protein [Psychromarinibacter sp. S121]|uniref:SH3 domain-containing protein n=1 Tax=Psychromarinibacter sp. S121 TaxID=3415127 RepID=UPI003C7A694D